MENKNNLTCRTMYNFLGKVPERCLNRASYDNLRLDGYCCIECKAYDHRMRLMDFVEKNICSRGELFDNYGYGLLCPNCNIFIKGKHFSEFTNESNKGLYFHATGKCRAKNFRLRCRNVSIIKRVKRIVSGVLWRSKTQLPEKDNLSNIDYDPNSMSYIMFDIRGCCSCGINTRTIFI